MNTIAITIFYQGMLLKGFASPLQTLENALPSSLMIYLQGRCIGTLNYTGEKWTMDQPIDPEFIEALGSYIFSYLLSVKKAMNYN